MQGQTGGRTRSGARRASTERVRIWAKPSPLHRVTAGAQSPDKARNTGKDRHHRTRPLDGDATAQVLALSA
jgi:hypothetical protein